MGIRATRIMKPLLILCLFCSFASIAQYDTLNRVDENGLAQGYWIEPNPKLFSTDEQPGKIAEGYYVDGKKEGFWTKYHEDGVTPKLIGFYRNNRPNGKYTKIFPSGNVMEQGCFEKGHYKDTLWRYYRNGKLKYFGYHDDDGVEIEGTTYYYRKDLCLDSAFVYTREGYQGKMIRYSKTNCNEIDTIVPFGRTNIICFGPSKDIEIIYAEDGSVVPIAEPASSDPIAMPEFGLEVDTTILDPIYGGTLLETHTDTLNNVRTYKRLIRSPHQPIVANGKNRLMNEDDEIFVIGTFQDGKFWDGKVYLYDIDGILLKVLLYSKGKYLKDGRL